MTVPKQGWLPLWLLLNRVSRTYLEALGRRLGDLGIDRHFFILVLIGEAEGRMTQKHLAEILELETPAMTRILNSLVAKGLVVRVRSNGDRRGNLLSLTPDTRTSLPRINRTIRDLNRRAFTSLSTDLSALFPAALAEMKSRLEKAVSESSRLDPA